MQSTTSPPCHLALLTPTWRGDLVQFEVLRRALNTFGHGALTHHVIVQTEDLPAFAHVATGGVQLHSTADVLPPETERLRRLCADRTRHWSRHRTRLVRSANKRTGWFNWIRYAGWQTQQLCKLRAADCFDETVFVVLDSDCLPTGRYDFAALTGADGRSVYLENWAALDGATPGLDHRWATTAHDLLNLPWPAGGSVLNRLGTPYVLDRRVLTSMLNALRGNADSWIEPLMRRPPASWSEFAIYNAYVQHHDPDTLIRRLATPAEDGFVAHTPEHMAQLPALIESAFGDGAKQPGFFRVQSDARYHATQSADTLRALFDPYLDPL